MNYLSLHLSFSLNNLKSVFNSYTALINFCSWCCLITLQVNFEKKWHFLLLSLPLNVWYRSRPFLQNQYEIRSSLNLHWLDEFLFMTLWGFYLNIINSTLLILWHHYFFRPFLRFEQSHSICSFSVNDIVFSPRLT